MLMAHVIAKQAKAIEVELPRASQHTTIKPTTIMVKLEASGAMYLNDQPVTAAALRGAIADAVAKDSKLQVVISGDKAVSHGRVVWVLDLVKSLNVTSFAIQIDPANVVPPP
jgi:biopolymer transport protein ExbD